jgi:tetratricopeptide (TPR) repeat protein
VEIEFPFGKKETAGVAPARRTRLADACGEAEDSAPDLVLLGLVAPHSIPGGVMMLNPATRDRSEVGLGRAHTYLASRQRYSTVDGSIDPEAGPDGLRQFRGAQLPNYWFEEGSSGSPVFLDNAEQLAGIISLSEIGGNEGVTQLREAFVVPGTTIRKYLTARLAADAQAEKRGIDPAKLQVILAKLGQMDVPDDKIEERLDASVEDILAQAAQPVPVSNDGADIDAAIVASRAKLRDLDTAGALDVLQAKLDEEEQERTRRRVPLLKERAAVERLAFDYDAAKSTLADVTRLAPDDVLAFIDLGDLYWITGPLHEAANAFRSATEAARRQGHEFHLSVSFSVGSATFK